VIVPAVRAVAEALVKSVLPVTAKVPLETRDEVAVIVPPVIPLIVALTALNILEKRLDEVEFVELSTETVIAVAEAVLSVVWPDTARVPLDISDDVATMLPPVSVLIVAAKVLKIEVKNVVVVAFTAVNCVVDAFEATKEVTVVVASVEVPNATIPPLLLVVKLRFSTQSTPFQYIVAPERVPDASPDPPPETFIHFVEVPVDESTCPTVPVAPVESIIAKLMRILPFMVVEPKVVFPTLTKLAEVVLFVVVKLVEDKLTDVTLVVSNGVGGIGTNTGPPPL
jgi:hypothetical protein